MDFNTVNLISREKGVTMKTYSSGEVTEYLSANLKEWVFENGAIRRNFDFADFTEAFSFMTAFALGAEKAKHKKR